jgi:hypothetical protein
MASSRRRLSKDVEYVLSPAQTSGRGTPRLRRPAHLIPPAAKLQYGDEFLITTVDGQHCLCPNMFDSSMFLIPIRFVKEAGFFPLCVFTFERLERIHGGSFPDHHSSSNSFRDGDPTASRDSSSPFVYAGDDLSIRHRISSRYIQFDDCNSPIQEPAYSCANMTYKLCDRTKMRLQYRVSVDAEARCLLSRTEISIAAHTNEQSYLCPANRAAQDFCTEVMFANDRQCGWLIEPVSATDAQTTASINSDVHGMRCGCLGRIRSVHGLTLSYHPTALFPVFIPLDSVTSDGSWTDPESVWSLWMFEDADNCFNVSSSSSSGSVHLRHAVTARLLRVGGACKHSSSDPESTETFINTIGVAENRGSQFSVHVIDQNRFMLSCGDAARPLVIQSTQTELAVLNFLPSGDDLFRSANTPISLSTAAPGCSSLNILTACPFRSENSVILWHPASDRIQHQIYCMSPLLISTANARAELLSQMGATHLASIPPPESAALNPFEAVAEHELERSLRDSVQVVKNMGDFFSQNMTFIGDKVMSVGAPSANVFAATNTADAGRSTIPHSLQHGGSTEAECLDSLCQLASSLLDPLTEVIRDTLAVLQSQGVNAMKIMQSLDILPVLGEIAFLFSSYLVHMLSSVRKGHQDDAQSLKPLLNKCVFVGSVVSGPMPSFYQHVVAFRSCIKSHYHGPTAQQVLSDMQGGIGSNECWRGLESLLYLSPSFRTFTTCVSEMVRLCAHALTAYECDANLFTCIVTAVPYYIHCDQTLMGLLKHNLIRVKYGESVLDIAFQRLISFFKKNCFFSESHLLRRLVSKSSAQHEFWISEGSFWINVINFFAEQRDLEGLAFRRQIFSLILQSTRQGGALPAFKSTNGGSALLVCRPSVSLHNSLDAQNIQPQNATARWVTSGGLLSVGRGNDVEPGWTDLMSCDVQKTPSLSITGNSIPPHEVVALVSATMLLYHNLVFHEDLKKCTPHVWSDLLQFVCRQCPSEFVLGCLSNPLFSYDIRRAACKLTTRLAFQCVRRQFSMPILSWGSEKIIPVLDVECNRTTFFKWIDDYKSLTSILMNLLECFKPEEDSRRPPPALAIAILELACEAIANNLWTDLPSIKQFYSIFSGIFLHALSPDQNRERALNLSIINEYLPFLQGHYIKAIRDGFNFVSVEPGETVCSGRGLASDPCVIICQFGELSMCYDDLGNGAVCISTVSTGETVGLEILNLVATNWFDEAGLSSAPIAQKKCIATRRSQLWVITRSALMSAVLARSHAIDLFNPVSNVEIDVRCRAASAMSLCLELEQKVFCLQAVRQMRLHINLAPGIYIQPCRPFKQQRPSESLSVVLGDASASIVENLFRASGGHLLINDTRIMGYRINRAACAVFLIHAIVSLGLTTLKILNRLGNAQDASVGKNDNMSHEFLAVMFILWFFCSLFGLYSVSSRKPRLIQWALVGHSISVITAIFGLIVSSYTELEQLSYVTILSKLSAALLAIFFEGYLFLIVLTYFALLSKKEAYRASVELSLKNQEIVDNLLLDHFSRNQLFASSANVIFSQIASNESRLSETASNFFLSNCQNKAKLFAALESCVLLRTPHSEMVFQALIAACNDLYKNALELIETILSLSHPPSFQEKRRLWPPILLDTSMLSQSGRLISILVDLKIKVSVIYNTLRKEAAKYDGKSGVMSPSEWRRVAYASQLDNSLCIIVGVAQSICTYVTGFESLHFNSEQGNQLVSACLELLAWCCVEDVRWQEIVAELMHEVGPTIVFICPTQAAAAIAECSRNNTKVRVMHGKKMVHLLCAPFDPKNIKFMKNNHIEALLHALRILIAGSVVSATLPVENLGEYVIAHVLPFASKILEQLGSVKCRFIACDDSDVQDHVEISSDIVSDRQLVPCGRCEGTGMQKGFKCCFCDGKRYVSVSLAQAPSNVFFDEHGLSIAPMAADATSKVQVYGSRPSKGPEWWTRFGEKCCQETLYLLAVTCELGNHYISSQIRGVISFDCAGKAACDPSASTELRAALVRFCASVHIPAATVNNIDRRWANPVHPAWLITDAMSRYVQDNPVSRLDDVSHDINSPAYVLLSVWTPVIESVCKRVLAHNTRAMCKPIMEILRRFADSICISGCSSTNITFCQNAVSCLSVLRALDLRAQVNLFETFDNYVAQEVFAQNALVSLSKTSDLSASTSDISALRWKSYISAIKPPAEHIEIEIADQLIQAEPGIHLAKSVASTIAFNLCSSCRKGGQLFDQHDTWSDVVRGITQSIEPCASKIPKNSLFSVKWISEGVCNIIIDSISMAATYSRHRFAHSSGGLYLGIRFLHSFKLQGQELLLQAILNRGDDNFFAGLIAIIDEAAVTAPRVSTFYSQIVQTLKREQLSRDAMLTQVSTDDHVHSARKPVSIEESKVWKDSTNLSLNPRAAPFLSVLLSAGLLQNSCNAGAKITMQRFKMPSLANDLTDHRIQLYHYRILFSCAVVRRVPPFSSSLPLQLKLSPSQFNDPANCSKSRSPKQTLFTRVMTSF